MVVNMSPCRSAKGETEGRMQAIESKSTRTHIFGACFLALAGGGGGRSQWLLSVRLCSLRAILHFIYSFSIYSRIDSRVTV